MEPGGFALRPVPAPPRKRCCTGSPRIVGSGLSGCPGVPMTDPQAGKQPSSGTNRPVADIRATGDCLDGLLTPVTYS